MAASTSVAGAPGRDVFLGKYRLLAELGQGGMARVYVAVAQGPGGFNKLLVIKEILPELVDDPDFLAMFLDEAKLAARVSHPNVVQTIEVDQDGRRHFIAMEYLEGQPFNRVLARLGRDSSLTLGMRLLVLAEVLAGLHHAHELCDYDGTPLGVVHRDVSPHNAFVTYDGQVKIMDFGVAKTANASAQTQAGVLKGKIQYMSPEQARGEPIDRRADVFAVGMMMWETLTGQRLYKGLDDLVILNRLVSLEPMAPPSTIRPDVPKDLEAICMKALSPSPGDRHATALELATEIEAALAARGERPSLRELGKLVAKTFGPERERIKATIDAELRRDGHALHGLPSIEAAPNAATGSGPSASAARPATDGPAGAQAPSPAKGRRGALILGVAAVALAVVGGAAAWPSDPAAPEPSVAAAPASAAAPVEAYTLTIESTPPGAMVVEDGVSLGPTPLAVVLDPLVAGARTFVVTKDGYAPYSFEQSRTTQDVRVVAALVALPASPPPPRKAQASEKAAPAVKPAAAAPAAPAGPTAPPAGKNPLQIDIQ